MYRLFLAIRYLWSRPISWVSMVAVWLSVMALIVTLSIMTGFLDETRRVIRGTTADLILTPRAIPLGPDRVMAPPPFDVIRRIVGEVDGVAALSPHLLRPALFRPSGISADVLGNRKWTERNFVQVVGLDPVREAAATAFEEHVRSTARDADPPDDPARPFWIDPQRIPAKYRNLPREELPVVLVGVEQYNWYGLRKGDVVTLATVPDDAGLEEFTPLSQRFVVGGTFTSGNYQHDLQTVYVELDAARAFAESHAETTEVAVLAAPGADLGQVKARILAARDAARLPPESLEVETWEDRHARMLGAVENERSILGFILFFFVAVACFNVFATVTIMVSDKTKDIGVLTALGATPRGILDLFVGCGLMITVFAATVGCVSGVLVARYINVINDLIAELFGVRIFRAEIYLFDRIPVTVELWFVAAVFLATVSFAALFTLVPALRAARMDPVRALRYE